MEERIFIRDVAVIRRTTSTKDVDWISYSEANTICPLAVVLRRNHGKDVGFEPLHQVVVFDGGVVVGHDGSRVMLAMG